MTVHLALDPIPVSTQKYFITIWDLFEIKNGEVCGAETTVSIMRNGNEIGREVFWGMCCESNGYRRTYLGEPGLTAVVVAGPGRISFSPA